MYYFYRGKGWGDEDYFVTTSVEYWAEHRHVSDMPDEELEGLMEPMGAYEVSDSTWEPEDADALESSLDAHPEFMRSAEFDAFMQEHE